jgi:hypothetical protein
LVSGNQTLSARVEFEGDLDPAPAVRPFARTAELTVLGPFPARLQPA